MMMMCAMVGLATKTPARVINISVLCRRGTHDSNNTHLHRTTSEGGGG